MIVFVRNFDHFVGFWCNTTGGMTITIIDSLGEVSLKTEQLT